MQKVVGSSPIIRFVKGLLRRAFFVLVPAGGMSDEALRKRLGNVRPATYGPPVDATALILGLAGGGTIGLVVSTVLTHSHERDER